MAAVTSINSATIKMTQIDKAIGPITIDTNKQSDGVFTSTASFGVPGKWDVIIEGVNSQGSNMIASLDLNVKPQVSNLDFSVNQYRTPTSSMPLFPVFDAERQAIWVGDSLLGSGRIWQPRHCYWQLRCSQYYRRKYCDANGARP